MSELKLCPFCGGEAEVTFEVDGTCAVECVSCGALVDGIDAWNTRADDAENAKLRELVKDAWGNGHPDRSCGECDIRDDCHADMEESRQHGERYTRCLFERRIEERMHELGIEVDG